MTDDPMSPQETPSNGREHTEITPGAPRVENVVMVILGMLCTIAVIVHVVLVFT